MRTPPLIILGAVALAGCSPAAPEPDLSAFLSRRPEPASQIKCPNLISAWSPPGARI